jgi:PEGA domain
MRKEVKIAGAVDERVAFELLPSEGKVARLTVSSELPDADVLVDGVIAGKTPLLGTIKVEPKEHTIEVRRAGYRTFERKLNFPDGDIIPLLANLDEDADWIAANGGFLKLGFSEEHAMVMVDGVSRGEYLASLHLAPGVHRLHAERAGFATVERDVQVMTGQTTTTRIEFEPNPDTLVKFKEDHALRRKWGIATTATGAALAFGGTWVAMYFYAESVRKDKPSEQPHRGEVALD